MIRKQAAGQVRCYATLANHAGGYYTLLAAALNRWVLDAQGRSWNKAKHGTQKQAIAALNNPMSERLLLVKAVAAEVGVEPAVVLEALRERVTA